MIEKGKLDIHDNCIYFQHYKETFISREHYSNKVYMQRFAVLTDKKDCLTEQTMFLAGR